MMLDCDDSVISLDLSCRSDGLLVGFRSRSPIEDLRQQQQQQQDQTTSLLSSSSQRKAGWGQRLFRRQSSSNMEEKSLLRQSPREEDDNFDHRHYRDDEGDDYEDGYGLIRDSPAKYGDKSSFQRHDDEDEQNTESKFRDSTNMNRNGCRDVTTTTGCYASSSKQQQQQFQQWQSQSFSDIPQRQQQQQQRTIQGSMQGFGNCDPRQDSFSNSKSDGFGSFFKRLYGHQDERQSMRIATEKDTMEETSWTDNLGRVAAVLLAPELCDDPDEDLDRLAMYRAIESDVDDTDEGSNANETMFWKKEVQRLKAQVEVLEREVKLKDMEVTTWKHRANELDRELRKVKGTNEDESTEGQDDDDEEEEDEEEDEEEHDVVEGDLLGIVNEGKENELKETSLTHADSFKQTTELSIVSPIVHATAVPYGQQPTQSNEDQQLVVDTTTSSNKVSVSDPLNPLVVQQPPNANERGKLEVLPHSSR